MSWWIRIRRAEFKRAIFLWGVVIFLAFLATFVPFLGHFFNISVDGIYHLSRFQQISDVLKSHNFPQVVNFKYISRNSFAGVAINSFYPWLTGLIFIIPNMLLHNPIWGLACGYFILNLITILSIGRLLSYLKLNSFSIFTGIIIYEFNSFHFIDMYSRVALGEAIAYAFFPIVLLGLMMIDNQDKNGYLVLSLGMGLIINTHILSFLFAVGLVVGYIFFAIFSKRKNMANKLFQIFTAAGLSFVLGFYVIYNNLFLSIRNVISLPAKYLVPLDANSSLQALLSNSMEEHQTSAWHLGLPVTVLIFILFILSFQKDRRIWKNWVLISSVLYLLLFSWLPFDILKNNPLETIQFMGRILCIVALLFSVGVGYFVQAKEIRYRTFGIVNMLIVIFTLAAMHQLHYNYLAPSTSHVAINSKNYYSLLENSSTFDDFLPAKHIKQSNILSTNSQFRLIAQKSEINSVSYSIESKEFTLLKLPVVTYNGLNYKVYNNGTPIRINPGQILEIPIHSGRNNITVKSIGNYHMLAFLITALGFVGVISSFIILRHRGESKR